MKRSRSYEVQARREYERLREERRNRFRILACIDGTPESLAAARFAARIGWGEECDIILLYVRPVDQGLRSGGLQVRVARQNMMDWGLDLPGIRHLREGMAVLEDEGLYPGEWTQKAAHEDTWSDPLGDNKVEYIHSSGKSVVLKLKTAPEAASGILDQYELGPYNVIILGEPSRWRGEFKSIFDTGVAQKVAMLSPSSVLVARKSYNKKGYFLCVDGSEHCLDAVRRAAVLARYAKQSITLFSVASDKADRDRAEAAVDGAKNALKELKIRANKSKTAVGNPVEQICRNGNGHSVIVVSDSGKGRITRFFVGSVAFDVMRSANTSVLNVR